MLFNGRSCQWGMPQGSRALWCETDLFYLSLSWILFTIESPTICIRVFFCCILWMFSSRLIFAFLTWCLIALFDHSISSWNLSKNLTITPCQEIVTSLSFFQFMANLQPSGSWIRDGWSIELTFSLIVTFYLTKPENRTALILKLWVKVLFLQKKCWFFAPRMLTSTKLKEPWY